jgi:RING-like zinc finger
VLIPTEKQDTSKMNADGSARGKEDLRSGQSNKRPVGKNEDEEALKGGSITPGSGEYGHAAPGRNGRSKSGTGRHASSEDSSQEGHNHATKGSWFSHFPWSKSAEHNTPEPQGDRVGRFKASSEKSSISSPSAKNDHAIGEESADEHEGLWVTLTPTTMSTSPFFDTLLVLVVSPLVTLSVVYALLLLRSRIRRRRWRAPKSVVDRLPVRVYHTMSCSSSTTSSQITTPTTSSPTSPLLRSTSRTVPARNRPRSQTTSSVIPSAESTSERSFAGSPPAQEKVPNAPVWRKRYTGRQVECVVCLEEYVDGQSLVMSLPCGHEFHVDCM